MYEYYCNCKNIKGTLVSPKLHKTVVDNEGNCIYCEYCAYAKVKNKIYYNELNDRSKKEIILSLINRYDTQLELISKLGIDKATLYRDLKRFNIKKIDKNKEKKEKIIELLKQGVTKRDIVLKLTTSYGFINNTKKEYKL